MNEWNIEFNVHTSIVSKDSQDRGMLMVAHEEIPLCWETKCGKYIGPGCGSLGVYPNMSVESVNKFIMIVCFGRNHHKILIHKDMLNFRVRHHTVLGCQDRSLTNDPIILIDVVTIAQHNIDIVVESESINCHSINIHSHFEECPQKYFLIRC